MKTLVHNYSSEISTEAMYVAQYLAENDNEVKIWNNQESAFDVFDDFRPDVFLTYYSMLTKDIAKRIKGEGIKSVINVTGATLEHIDVINEIMENHYCFQNYKILPDIKVIAPCADLYLANSPSINLKNYAVESLFIVEDKEDLEAYKEMFNTRETYHVLTNNKELHEVKGVDSYVPISTLSKLYSNYEEIFIRRPSQAFYDAAYYGSGCNLFENTQSCVFLKKEVVKSLHSPYNRVKDLLEWIGENTNK